MHAVSTLEYINSDKNGWCLIWNRNYLSFGDL